MQSKEEHHDILVEVEKGEGMDTTQNEGINK